MNWHPITAVEAGDGCGGWSSFPLTPSLSLGESESIRPPNLVLTFYVFGPTIEGSLQ